MKYILCLAAGWLTTGLSAADPAPKVHVRQLEEHMQSVIEEASASVVAIVVSHAKYPPLPLAERQLPGRLGRYTPAPPERSLPGFPRLTTVDRLDLSDAGNLADCQVGSGLVLDEKAGLILTTQHLIDGATKIYIRGPAGKGSYADIVAADSRSDLAVLRLLDRIEKLKPASLGTARLVDSPDGREKTNLKRGSWIIALGYPLGSGFHDGSPSASWGILSNIRRRSAQQPAREELRTKPLHTYGSLLQVDARVTLGSSGSALLNMQGEVIGLASTVAAINGSEVQGGYAIPLDVNYRRIIDVLKTGQEVEYGFLGVAPTVERGSVVINGLTPGCPAAVAGIREGDAIVSIDGQPLTEQDDLLLYVGGALAGSKVTVIIRRGGIEKAYEVVLAKMANPLPSVVTVPSAAYAGLRIDYSSIRLLQIFNTRDGLRITPPRGVCVRELEPNSAAEKRFKEAGDAVAGWIITHVDGKPIETPREFFTATQGKASVKLTLSDPSTAARTATVSLP